MAEYIEREVALKIVTDMMCDCKVTHKGRAIGRNIKQIPIADVVEVVRCKDCEHIRLIGKTPFAVRVCTHNKGLGDNVRENDFCSYGERKEGAE